MKISIFNQTLTIGRYSASLFFLFPEDKFYYFPVYLVDNVKIPFDVNVRNAVVPDVVEHLVDVALGIAQLVPCYACQGVPELVELHLVNAHAPAYAVKTYVYRPVEVLGR